jgi:hypothetical protein
MRWRWLSAGVSLLCVCCAACATRAPAPATLRVELLREPALPTDALHPRVEIVVDATASMHASTRDGIEHLAAARYAAQRLLRRLPEDSETSLFALGGQASTCEDPVSTPIGAEAGGRADQMRSLDGLRPRGEASFANALRERVEASEGEARSRRVVGITDLAPDCGADWCSLVPAFAKRGVRLDLIVMGSAEVPACLAESLESAPADPAQASAPPAPVDFSVESGAAGGGSNAVHGVADGPAVTLAPGHGTLVLQLDPPFRIDRQYPAGADLVLQVLDFPNRVPPVRRWRWVAASGEDEEESMNR